MMQIIHAAPMPNDDVMTAMIVRLPDGVFGGVGFLHSINYFGRFGGVNKEVTLKMTWVWHRYVSDIDAFRREAEAHQWREPPRVGEQRRLTSD